MYLPLSSALLEDTVNRHRVQVGTFRHILPRWYYELQCQQSVFCYIMFHLVSLFRLSRYRTLIWILSSRSVFRETWVAISALKTFCAVLCFSPVVNYLSCQMSHFCSFGMISNCFSGLKVKVANRKSNYSVFAQEYQERKVGTAITWCYLIRFDLMIWYMILFGDMTWFDLMIWFAFIWFLFMHIKFCL